MKSVSPKIKFGGDTFEVCRVAVWVCSCMAKKTASFWGEYAIGSDPIRGVDSGEVAR